MTGKRYYLTTLDAWQRHTHRLAGSHFVILDNSTAPASASQPAAQFQAESSAAPIVLSENPAAASVAAKGDCRPPQSPADSTRILALVEGDEGAHLALDDDPAFESLPHPLAQKPISSSAEWALANHGVASGATTYDVADALGRVHPLLRPSVF